MYGIIRNFERTNMLVIVKKMIDKKLSTSFLLNVSSTLILELMYVSCKILGTPIRIEPKSPVLKACGLNMTLY